MYISISYIYIYIYSWTIVLFQIHVSVEINMCNSLQATSTLCWFNGCCLETLRVQSSVCVVY